MQALTRKEIEIDKPKKKEANSKENNAKRKTRRETVGDKQWKADTLAIESRQKEETAPKVGAGSALATLKRKTIHRMSEASPTGLRLPKADTPSWKGTRKETCYQEVDTGTNQEDKPQDKP